MNDLDRLRQEYESRKIRLLGKNYYSLENPTYAFTIQQRHKALSMLLGPNGINSLYGTRVLEIGCGSGGVLAEYQEFGVESTSLFGIDLLFDRLLQAHEYLPCAPIINADGQFLPFQADSFDMVLQYTAFSSILDDAIKQKMARDMLRVLRPDGRIIWYDFWWNPVNRQTRGIRPREIKALFPGCGLDFNKITLAPPIARRIVPLSQKLAGFLESIKIFNSHFLVLIKKESK